MIQQIPLNEIKQAQETLLRIYSSYLNDNAMSLARKCFNDLTGVLEDLQQ